MHISEMGLGMGAAERKEQEKEIRRRDIIQAAERVFFAKGPAVATMDDVAREAEFSKRTVYAYFRSKEELQFEIMLRGYRLLNGRLDEWMAGETSSHAIERLRRLGLILYAFSREYPDYFRSIMEYENAESDFTGLPDRLRDECYEQGELMFRHLVATLDKGIAEGVIRADLDSGQTAHILWSCAVGLFTTAERKSHYIRLYHGGDPAAMIMEGFGLLLSALGKERQKEAEK